MNPLDFLNEAIRKIVGGPTLEDDLRVKYVETLVNPGARLSYKISSSHFYVQT